MIPHRTPCSHSADDRARRSLHHHTLCTWSADDRARIFLTHHTPCTNSAHDRAGTRCTPCTSSEASPRARMAPSWEGLSSASCPSCSTLLSASRRHWHPRYPELQSSPSDATPSSSFLRALNKVPSIRKRAPNLIVVCQILYARCFVDVTHRSRRGVRYYDLSESHSRRSSPSPVHSRSVVRPSGIVRGEREVRNARRRVVGVIRSHRPKRKAFGA